MNSAVAGTASCPVLNRLKTLAFNGQNPGFGLNYDALSRRLSLTRPNGINTAYAYDPASHLLSVLHKLGTTTLDGATYTYDNAGNRKTRTDRRLNTTLTYVPELPPSYHNSSVRSPAFCRGESAQSIHRSSLRRPGPPAALFPNKARIETCIHPKGLVQSHLLQVSYEPRVAS